MSKAFTFDAAVKEIYNLKKQLQIVMASKKKVERKLAAAELKLKIFKKRSKEEADERQ